MIRTYLDPERLAQCDDKREIDLSDDAGHMATRALRSVPHSWHPTVPWRSDAKPERRKPQSSRFGDL